MILTIPASAIGRAVALALSLALLLPGSAAAQGSGPLIKYGKWVLAAGAVGMNLLAARDHDRAEEAFGRIEEVCFEHDSSRCFLSPDGTYADPAIERLYQTSLSYDRRARRWLIAGETVLLGAAALFVIEFTRKTHKPDNIPFEPEIRSLREATGVGIRVAW
jgi:hypothetical protein